MQPSFSLLAAPSDLLSSDPRHDRSPAPLLPLILGTLFSAFLLSLPAFLFLGHCGMWENAETLWQSLLFALFFSPFNFDINIVRVAPFFLELATLLPEAALVEAFAVSQVLGEIGVHVAANFFDLDYGALDRLLVGTGKLLHAMQECDDMIHTLIQHEQAFVNT